MRIIESTWMGPHLLDVLPPVALDYMRGHCPDCQTDVPVECHCLWAETGESWYTCTCCRDWEAVPQWE